MEQLKQRPLPGEVTQLDMVYKSVHSQMQSYRTGLDYFIFSLADGKAALSMLPMQLLSLQSLQQPEFTNAHIFCCVDKTVRDLCFSIHVKCL